MSLPGLAYQKASNRTAGPQNGGYRSLDISDIEGAKPRRIYHRREKLGEAGASIVDMSAHLMGAAGVKQNLPLG